MELPEYTGIYNVVLTGSTMSFSSFSYFNGKGWEEVHTLGSSKNRNDPDNLFKVTDWMPNPPITSFPGAETKQLTKG